MMGLEDTISSFIKQLRIDEITASRDARWVRVLLMSICWFKETLFLFSCTYTNRGYF